MQYLIQNIANSLLILMIILSFALILYYYIRIKKINNQLLVKDKKKKKNKAVKREGKLTKKFKETLLVVLMLKNKEHLYNLISIMFVVVLLIIFGLFLYINKPFLAVVMTSLVFFFTIKILEEMVIDFDSIIRKNFSSLVNHIVKVFSKTSDLSIVLYESSKEMEEPLRSFVLNLSKEIIVDNNEGKLIKYVEKTDNLWLHAFIFILINYKENSSKENVINSLLELSSMINNANELTEKMIADRKPVVIMNYVILVAGILIFIGNLIKNPIMKTFILSPFGTLCLIVGVSCMFSTVLMNMRLVKK